MPENGRVEFVHRSWPADPAQLSVIRRELAGWLAPLALTDDETAGVVLAVDEAAANAVRHAYGPGRSGVVELTLWTEPGTLCVEVVDHGNWVPPVEPPAVDGLADRGRGIPLMSSMAEAVLIHHDSRGSRVLLRHPVPADRDAAEAAERGRRRHDGARSAAGPGSGRPGRIRCRSPRGCRRPAGRARAGPAWAPTGRRPGRRSSPVPG